MDSNLPLKQLTKALSKQVKCIPLLILIQVNIHLIPALLLIQAHNSSLYPQHQHPHPLELLFHLPILRDQIILQPCVLAIERFQQLICRLILLQLLSGSFSPLI